jgi:hypothetical protein
VGRCAAIGGGVSSRRDALPEMLGVIEAEIVEVIEVELQPEAEADDIAEFVGVPLPVTQVEGLSLVDREYVPLLDMLVDTLYVPDVE